MKEIVVTPGKKGSVRLADVERPVPTGSQALLRVVRVGIDRTDIDINAGFYGTPPPGSKDLIVGHECLATIEEIPKSSMGLAKGDLVVPTVRRPDDCLNCRSGESDMCLTGNYKEHGIKDLNGFASDYTVSDVDFLVKVPSEIEDVAVLLEPTSIVEKGLSQIFKIQQRMVWQPRRALVLGAGSLGLLTTVLLRIRGLEVYTVATRPKTSLKARLAERSGATYVNSQEQPIDTLGSFDIILEETGVASVAAESVKMLNKNGVLCLLGIYEDKEMLRDIGRVYRKLVLSNNVVFGSVNSNKGHFEAGIKDLLQIKKLFKEVLPELMTKVIPPEEYKQAYEKESENEIKTVIEFQKQP
ncbi:MAG: glucose 1-dehydrogenase [Thaumarchaeota archaeon]|nr:glucose 1-dehydrogenase [Nitrososphaerota archaeon]MCL5317407.1 glucose 1-dehydrogenase [Nitrososphaerota archaeon]